MSCSCVDKKHTGSHHDHRNERYWFDENVKNVIDRQRRDEQAMQECDMHGNAK